MLFDFNLPDIWKELLEEFTNYFKTGYEFEEFLKPYLIQIGFEEVEVTKKAKDGGFDLTAKRKGVGEFANSDVINYKIQAKKFAPSSPPISVKEIRALKGALSEGEKGIFITTTRFSKDATSEANVGRQILLVDGETLIKSCINNGIGFKYQPIFSSESLDSYFKSKQLNVQDNKEQNIKTETDIDFIFKTISANDIRARILSMPTSINELISDKNTVNMIVNNGEKKDYTISKTKKYLGGVTDILRGHNLLAKDGSLNPKTAKWHYSKDEQCIYLVIDD